MIDQQLLTEFNALDEHEKMIMALLAIVGEPIGKHALCEHLQRANINEPDGTHFRLAVVLVALQRLVRLAMLSEAVGRGFSIDSTLRWPAIRAAIEACRLRDLCDAVETISPVRRSWDHFVELRSYRQGVARLRIALLRGDAPQQVAPILNACLACYEAGQLHPLIDICARPFEPEMMARIHPQLQDEILAILVNHSQREPETAPTLALFCVQHLQRQLEAGEPPAAALCMALAEHAIVCGALEQADALLRSAQGALAQFLRCAAAQLRGDQDGALAGYDAALKLLRRESGKRKLCFPGMGGHLYVLALLRSNDPKLLKQAETYLDLALRAQHNHDSTVYQQLSMLRQIRAGTLQADALPSRNWETQLQAQMFQALLYYWLALPQLEERKPQLQQLVRQANAGGFYFIAAQAAGLLGRMGDAELDDYAAMLRKRHGFVDLAPWFERQEAWQRQLSALINLQPQGGAGAPAQVDGKSSRLVWLIGFNERDGVSEIEPREQKRDARGAWSKGRAMGLKRLYEEAATIDFLAPQDVRVAATIGPFAQYYSSSPRYEVEREKALVALVGHPLVFRLDAPETRLDLLAGAPELLIKANGGELWITLQPPLPEHGAGIVVTKETPTRLRVIHILDEHRRIGAIVGAGLAVPLHAEQQVLQAIGALSSLVTVQSDIVGGADNVEQIAADARLHVHLLPYQQGLKMQILVRPLSDGGAYYAPGSGAESVFADVAGRPVQARRELDGEREARRQLVDKCRALEAADEEHGEWLLGQPATCLQLLVELQELDPETLVLAWPEGESFRVSKRVESQQLRLAIKGEKDWFAASGELQIDEGKVLDLRALLELIQNGKSRFVALGENQFLALSDELHRRLSELAAYGQAHGDGVRVHPLASFALEELANDAGGVKADKLWKEHMARLCDQAGYVPQLPSTLQAELRDYQLAGFEWLARLANWGVGACLADDMGLGKTLQALALILARAPHGPTLVVAPTSVCMNWLSEAARFAPTLNLVLFGAGDRKETLSGAGAFDLVVTSYGLLQQEAQLFADVQWHTVVLDEAQAIKNGATKRSQAVMALQADFRMVATGTPLENHLGELWNLFRFINPGLLGTLDQFNLRFAGPIERAAEPGARLRLRRLIQPFILRRTKSQVLSELPPRTEIVMQVELSAQETALYESLRRAALEKLAMVEEPAAKKAIQILAEIMKLRRACCNPHLVAPELGLASSKLAAFAQLLSGLLENRHKVLVFSQFVDHLSLIRQHLDQHGVRYQYLDGSTPMLERKVRVDAFQAGDGDVFLISLKAGGMGINLTAADYVIHMDPWWNPAVEDQASDRAHRMGQLRPVTIYRLVAKHTIEESIVNLHKHKRDLADSLLEGSDAVARMSAGDMLGMLQEGLRQ
ncbi:MULTISPECIES: DEAD/DEAH box helicase [unclassified Janthinobacterium]|uniref:DEAD/DEAH box helicase n=1 Tax=unclassified Janthinobacterium TaxID=2610881 RepID=UPI00034A6FFF|nr:MULTISPECIES: DEAD/DEAH box helicase [unclassified Janthinobacterium]MEC5162832.1 SNF2 family DNA or RNA helicase [Janthinobacterium sp. CG_S6]